MFCRAGAYLVKTSSCLREKIHSINEHLTAPLMKSFKTKTKQSRGFKSERLGLGKGPAEVFGWGQTVNLSTCNPLLIEILNYRSSSAEFELSSILHVPVLYINGCSIIFLVVLHYYASQSNCISVLSWSLQALCSPEYSPGMPGTEIKVVSLPF